MEDLHEAVVSEAHDEPDGDKGVKVAAEGCREAGEQDNQVGQEEGREP